MGLFHSKYKSKSLTSAVGLLLLLITIFALTPATLAQSRRKIIIKQADSLLTNKDIPGVQRLIGNVILTHENIVLTCDSAWLHSNSNMVDAFNNVHIVSNDTLDMKAQHINYNSENKMAKARFDVILTDPSLTLTTDSLDYDMENNIGYYNYGGKVIDSTTILTSTIGQYYSQLNDVFFKEDVVAVHENYTIYSDTMKYNTELGIVKIIGPTRIIGDSTYIYSEDGWYDTNTKISQLEKNSILKRGETQMQGDFIHYDDHGASGFAKGNVIINDFKSKIIVAGHHVTYNDFSQNAVVSDSALFIIYDKGDSLFLHADTLFTMPDTSATDAKIIKNYHQVRFFKTDLQGACDSLVYFSKDSTIQLFNEPIIWTQENQMTGDFIEIVNKKAEPTEVHIQNNAFIIQQVDSTLFNQIKGKNMIGYIKENQLYLVDVDGNGQSVYYPADDKGVFGINHAESSNIRLYLAKNKIQKINFVTTPTGFMDPIQTTEETSNELEGFDWKDAIRPKDQLQIFSILDHPSRMPLKPIVEALPPLEEMKINQQESESCEEEEEQQQLIIEKGTEETIIPQREKPTPKKITEEHKPSFIKKDSELKIIK